MKTIAQQLNIKKFPFNIHDTNGRKVYFENSAGYWYKIEYDTNGKEIYFENSDGFWWKKEYDTNSKEVYGENSDGIWEKREYDTNSKEVYFENSDGTIRDNRPKHMKECSMVEAKEFSMDEIAKVMGIPVEQLKIRK